MIDLVTREEVELHSAINDEHVLALVLQKVCTQVPYKECHVRFAAVLIHQGKLKVVLSLVREQQLESTTTKISR